MRLFDSLMYLGRSAVLEPFRQTDVKGLQAALDRYGISRALVTSFAARQADITYGNELTFDAASRESRLVPCPVVVPDATLEPDHVCRQVRRLVARGARAVCMYPQLHAFKLDTRIVGDLFSVLEQHRLPVSLPDADPMAAADIAVSFPELPVILHAPAYRNRNLLALLRATPNLVVSLAPNFAPCRGLEMILKHCGPHRLVFASSYPVAEPGAPLGYLLYSGLDDDAVQRIAARTMETMVRNVRPRPESAEGVGVEQDHTTSATGTAPSSWTGLCAHVRGRQPLPLKGIVDMHGHYGEGTGWPKWCVDAEDLVRHMDRIGIESIMVSHNVVVGSCEARWGNDQVLSAMRRYPNRILGYAICDPKHEDSGVTEVQRCLEAGMNGIKLHLANGLPYDSPLYEPIWALAAEQRLPVLLHTWGDNIDSMLPLFRRWTGATILVGHAGSGNIGGYVRVAQECPHVYLETCYSHSPYGVIERFVDKLGAERVVWGSDATWMSMGQQMGRLLFAGISDADKETILVHNPRRILARP